MAENLHLEEAEVNRRVVGVAVLVLFQMVKSPVRVTVRVTVRGVSAFVQQKCLGVEVEAQTWVIHSLCLLVEIRESFPQVLEAAVGWFQW